MIVVHLSETNGVCRQTKQLHRFLIFKSITNVCVCLDCYRIVLLFCCCPFRNRNEAIVKQKIIETERRAPAGCEIPIIDFSVTFDFFF